MRALYDVPAPAKLNLFLHVIGRRADGYHMLESVFTLIDWCDTLHFERRDDAQVLRHDIDDVGLPTQDLSVRAALALQQASGCRAGVDIHIQKRIPTQAGMGGGSSDAASTLLALNRLWDTGLTRADLIQLGASLGADVPFFLFGRSAWVSGIGEQLQAVDVPDSTWLVVKPAEGLDTREIFSNPTLKRDTQSATMRGFAADPFGYGHNDLQPVAQCLCPSMVKAMQALIDQGLSPRMTGSGSAVFARVDTPCTIALQPGNWLSRVCRGVAVHPLFDWAM